MSIITNIPAVLHVGGLVHADSQFDFQIHVLTVLWNYHLVQLCRFGPISGGVQDHLDRPKSKTGVIIRTVAFGWAAEETGVKVEDGR